MDSKEKLIADFKHVMNVCSPASNQFEGLYNVAKAHFTPAPEWVGVDVNKPPKSDKTLVFQLKSGGIKYGSIKIYAEVWYFRERKGSDFDPCDVKQYTYHSLPTPTKTSKHG